MKYQLISQYRSEYPLGMLCRTLGVSRSGYYKHAQGIVSPRALADQALVTAMRALAIEHYYRYGSPRMTVALRRCGFRCSEKRVARLMRQHQLGARRNRRKQQTTRRDPYQLASPNLLNRGFTIGEINRVWLTDITFILTREGWLYLSAVLDLASRKILSWSMSKELMRESAMEAIERALTARREANNRAVEQLMLHSDQGTQYTSNGMRALLKEHDITQSMSRTGNCWDNAPMESFFKTLKCELVDRSDYATRREATESIASYIEYYNYNRLHSSIGYMPPVEWEQNHTIKTGL
jgi:putative transposase